MRNSILLVMIFIFSMNLFSQEQLYMPLNIQKAYENETRSPDGKPGKNHWINTSHYIIEAELDTALQTIRGTAEINYFNNSPDTLKQVYIRLYPEIFRKGNTRDFPINPFDIGFPIEISFCTLGSDTFHITNETARNENWVRRGTNLILKPKTPVFPESDTELKISWKYKLPEKTPIRMGIYDDGNSYFIAYWYPQIAVYDDIDGWDRFSYLGLSEFYLDPATFDVKIKVPNNYVVWGAGRLQNADEVLSEKYLDRYEKALESNEIISIIDSIDIEKEDITLQNKEGNIWHFKTENAPDFAWAASDHYLWDGSLLELDGIDVFVDAAYNKKSADFYEVAAIAKRSIKYFSEEMPAIPFPYPSLTVFNGHGGMEFPMMVNDGSAETNAGTVHVTSHEIAHTYFPFNLTTNERKYSFMDEGWAVMLPFEFQAREVEDNDPRAREIRNYLRIAGDEMEISMLTPSVIVGGNAYGVYRNVAYSRPAIAYQLLQDYLCKEVFVKALQEYTRRWKNSHPIPWDFYNTVNDVSGKDLTWFWKPWFFDYGYPDIKITGVERLENEYTVTLEKIGSHPIPIDMTITYDDSTSLSFQRKMDSWISEGDEIKIKFKSHKDVIKIELGNKYIPDVDMENNIWEKK